MNCQNAVILISGKLDGELDPQTEKQLDEHLAGCEVCSREYSEMKKLKEVTVEMKFADLPDRYWAGYWNVVYNKLERGVGWILLSLGAITLLALGAWEFVSDFLLNSDISIIARIGTAAGILGIIILLVSILRERLFARKQERYEEVQR